MQEILIKSSCIVCGGGIIERSFTPCIPLSGERNPGLGYRNVVKTNRIVDGYHCGRCGVQYYKLPDAKKH